MEDILGIGVIDSIYKYGALPLLLLAVKVLWSKVDKHESQIILLNEAQKTDLRNHADEVKSIAQNTINAINEQTNAINNLK